MLRLLYINGIFIGIEWVIYIYIYIHVYIPPKKTQQLESWKIWGEASSKHPWNQYVKRPLRRGSATEFAMTSVGIIHVILVPRKENLPQNPLSFGWKIRGFLQIFWRKTRLFRFVLTHPPVPDREVPRHAVSHSTQTAEQLGNHHLPTKHVLFGRYMTFSDTQVHNGTMEERVPCRLETYFGAVFLLSGAGSEGVFCPVFRSSSCWFGFSSLIE